MSSTTIQLIAIITSIILAFCGYLATYLNKLKLSKRSEKLSLINQQIDKLYGPLYIITQTSRVLFLALQEKMHLKGKNIDDDAPNNDADLSEWRLWVENVFLVYNDHLEKLILNNAHLIIEDDYPDCFKLFCAHQASLRIVVEKWKHSNYTEKISMINYPLELNEYAENRFRELKAEQRKIILERKKDHTLLATK